MLTIRIYNHSPRKTRGKNVLKSVNGGGEAGVGQESLSGEKVDSEKGMTVLYDFGQAGLSQEKTAEVSGGFLFDVEVYGWRHDVDVDSCLEVPSVGRGDKKAIEHPHTNL